MLVGLGDPPPQERSDPRQPEARGGDLGDVHPLGRAAFDLQPALDGLKPAEILHRLQRRAPPLEVAP